MTAAIFVKRRRPILVDDGKLGLDDPLAKFLPEFSRVQVKGQTQPTGVLITIRQLMMHTSGMAAERPPELENITRTFDHTCSNCGSGSPATLRFHSG